MNINEQLERLRKQRGLSARQLEDLCGIAQQTISRFEKGKNSKTFDMLNEMLKPMCAYLQIIEMPEPLKSKKQLQRLTKGGTPQDYIEQKFMDEWMSAKPENKDKVVDKYTTTHIDVKNKEGI